MDRLCAIYISCFSQRSWKVLSPYSISGGMPCCLGRRQNQLALSLAVPEAKAPTSEAHRCEVHRDTVFGWVKLIFFIAAYTVLGFGFVTKTMWMIQGYFPCCWAELTQGQGLFCSSSHSTSKELGVQKTWRGGHSQDN